jgi:hypothetical protein
MPATLLQKTRGTQSATNTLAGTSNLQPITTDEQNCLKQTTFGQAGVLPEESIPMVDLQNHADNSGVNTNKTGFKNYFNQETLNNFFGWNSGTSTFKTYAGSAGKILAGFLDPAWVSSVFTKSTPITASQYIKDSKSWYHFPNSAFTQVSGNTGGFPIPLPSYTAGDKFNLSFEFVVGVLIQNTTFPSGGSIQIKPWIRKNTAGAKVFLTSLPPYNTLNPTTAGRVDLAFMTFNGSNTYTKSHIFRDVTFLIDTSIDVGITSIDFGYDVDVTNIGGPYTGYQITQFGGGVTGYAFDGATRLISLEIYRA